MRSEHYYILDENNTPQGPYTLLRLRAFINAGDIKVDDLVCQEGGEHWITLETLFSPPQKKPIKQYLIIFLRAFRNSILCNPLLISLAVISALLVIGITCFSKLRKPSLASTAPASTLNSNKHNEQFKEQKKVIREKDAERKRFKRAEKKLETVKESSVSPLFQSSNLFLT